MRAIFTWLIPALTVVALVGCTNVCDEGAEVLARCDLDLAVEPETAIDCSGEHGAFSQCLVDYPDAACDYYYDPVAYEGNAFDLCVRAISSL